MIWTTDQEVTLREFGHLDAQGAADAIFGKYRERRSVEATALHASRIHVSLEHRLVCPECGCMVTYLNRQTGLCKRFVEFHHFKEKRAFNDLLEAKCQYAENSPEIEATKYEYDTLRQRNARLFQRYGLKGKAERNDPEPNV